MMAYHRQQLTELLTNYGKIDTVCLDMWLGKEVWPQLRETMSALRKLQPDVMFRARGIGNYGDYYTPERFVPGGETQGRSSGWITRSLHSLSRSKSAYGEGQSSAPATPPYKGSAYGGSIA